VSLTAALWAALVVLVVVGLVALGYLVGRGLWGIVQPGDQDPGGKESPPALLPYSTGTPFVEYLRLYRKLRRQRAKTRPPKNDF
jgi:hypothetical protein